MTHGIHATALPENSADPPRSLFWRPERWICIDNSSTQATRRPSAITMAPSSLTTPPLMPSINSTRSKRVALQPRNALGVISRSPTQSESLDDMVLFLEAPCSSASRSDVDEEGGGNPAYKTFVVSSSNTKRPLPMRATTLDGRAACSLGFKPMVSKRIESPLLPFLPNVENEAPCKNVSDISEVLLTPKQNAASYESRFYTSPPPVLYQQSADVSLASVTRPSPRLLLPNDF